MKWKWVGKYGWAKVIYEGSHCLPRLQRNDEEKMRANNQSWSKDSWDLLCLYKLSLYKLKTKDSEDKKERYIHEIKS